MLLFFDRDAPVLVIEFRDSLVICPSLLFAFLGFDLDVAACLARSAACLLLQSAFEGGEGLGLIKLLRLPGGETLCCAWQIYDTV